MGKTVWGYTSPLLPQFCGYFPLIPSMQSLFKLTSSGLATRATPVAVRSGFKGIREIPRAQMARAPHHFTVRNQTFAWGVRFFALEKNEVTERVIKTVKNFHKLADSKVAVTENSNFQKDLGLDSLDVVEVVMALEDEFSIEIPDADSEQIFSTADAIKYVLTHPQVK